MAEAAFGVRVVDYRGTTGQRFYAPSAEPRVPSDLAILGVAGLSNATQEQPMLSQAVRPHYGAGPNGTGLTPSQLRGIYGMDGIYAKGVDGTGQKLGLFELAGYSVSDVNAYEKAFNLPNAPLTNVSVMAAAARAAPVTAPPKSRSTSRCRWPWPPAPA